jgi:hypothetical protein
LARKAGENLGAMVEIKCCLLEAFGVQQKIWEPYYAMDFFKDAQAEGAGYWDRNEDNVYNLKNV